MKLLDKELLKERAMALEAEFNRLAPLNDKGVQEVYNMYFKSLIPKVKNNEVNEPQSLGNFYLRMLDESTTLDSEDHKRLVSLMVSFEWTLQGLKDFIKGVNKPIAKKYAELLYEKRDRAGFSRFLANPQFMQLLDDARHDQLEKEIFLPHVFSYEFEHFDLKGNEDLSNFLGIFSAALLGDQNIE